MPHTAQKSRVGFEGKLKWHVAATNSPLPVVTPRAALAITTSVRVKLGVYRLPATASLDSALLTVRGCNIVVVMRGVVLIGTADGATPDAARGIALLVDGGAHVRIEGLRARGYRHGVYKRAFAWTDSTDPRTQPAAFASLLRGTPLITRIESHLDYFSYHPTIASMPQAHMALDATTSLTLSAGDHTPRALSDDAVRVWVDNVLVINDWTPHETRPSYATCSLTRQAHRGRTDPVDGLISECMTAS